MIKLFESEDKEVIAVVQKASDNQKKQLKEEEDAQADDQLVNGERMPTEYNK